MEMLIFFQPRPIGAALLNTLTRVSQSSFKRRFALENNNSISLSEWYTIGRGGGGDNFTLVPFAQTIALLNSDDGMKLEVDGKGVAGFPVPAGKSFCILVHHLWLHENISLKIDGQDVSSNDPPHRSIGGKSVTIVGGVQTTGLSQILSWCLQGTSLNACFMERYIAPCMRQGADVEAKEDVHEPATVAARGGGAEADLVVAHPPEEANERGEQRILWVTGSRPESDALGRWLGQSWEDARSLGDVRVLFMDGMRSLPEEEKLRVNARCAHTVIGHGISPEIVGELRGIGVEVVEYGSADRNWEEMTKDFQRCATAEAVVGAALKWLDVYRGSVARNWAAFFSHRVAGAFSSLITDTQRLTNLVAMGDEDGVLDLLRELHAYWQANPSLRPEEVLARVRRFLFGEGGRPQEKPPQALSALGRIGTTFTEFVEAVPPAQRRSARQAWHATAELLGAQLTDGGLLWRDDAWIQLYCNAIREFAEDPETAVKVLGQHVGRRRRAVDVVAAALGECAGPHPSLSAWLEEVLRAMSPAFGTRTPA
jgi:hypothetical protein